MRQLIYLLALCVLVSTGSRAMSPPPAPRTTIVNDEFISGLLETVSYEKLSRTPYPKTSTPLKGGKVIRFTHGANTFSCYKSPYSVFITSFDVTQPDPVLTPFLSFGAPKSAVLKKLGQTKSLDILLVRDLEGGALATLTFQKGALTKISFAATYID